MADQALCAGLTGLFFSHPSQTGRVALAKALCAVCPRQPSCLEGALARREPDGIWGGVSFPAEARGVARRRAKANRQRQEEGAA